MKGEYISIETSKIMADIEKENKELYDRIDKVNNYVQEQKQEIEKLNNIINELEKYLDEALGQDMYRYDFKIILDKLQELKGSDKE